MKTIVLSKDDREAIEDAAGKLTKLRAAYTQAGINMVDAESDLFLRIRELFPETEGRRITLTHPRDGDWLIRAWEKERDSDYA